MFIYIYIYIYIYVYIYVYVCVCACVRACVYVYKSTYIKSKSNLSKFIFNSFYFILLFSICKR